jgi:hypothetical protein
MNPALKDRGYSEFSGLISPGKTKFIVNIPKNASSYIHAWAKEYGWMTTNLVNDDWNAVNQITVVLRDPVERWISGMAQYLKTYVLCPVGPNGPIYPDSPWAFLTTGTMVLSAQQFINFYNLSTERLIFDNIYRFDDHVWPQYAFFQNLRPYAERKYFMLDENFDKNFSPYVGGLPIPNLDRNEGEADPDTKNLQIFLKDLLDSRPDLLYRVNDAYKEDYALIKQAFNK